jgi:hypothetical protein
VAGGITEMELNAIFTQLIWCESLDDHQKEEEENLKSGSDQLRKNCLEGLMTQVLILIRQGKSQLKQFQRYQRVY